MSYNYKIKGIVINTEIKWLVRSELFVAYIGRGWSLPNVKLEEFLDDESCFGWDDFDIYPSLSLQFQLIVSFYFESFVRWFDLDEGETLRLLKNSRLFPSACFVKRQISPTRSFPVFHEETTSWCSRKCWPDTSCRALHWLQTNVLLMFLPLLEMSLCFLWLCCTSCLHLLEKGYLLENILLQLFDCKLSFALFCVTLFNIIPKIYFLYCLVSSFPQSDSRSSTTFPYIFLRASPSKRKRFAFPLPALVLYYLIAYLFFTLFIYLYK